MVPGTPHVHREAGGLAVGIEAGIARVAGRGMWHWRTERRPLLQDTPSETAISDLKLVNESRGERNHQEFPLSSAPSASLHPGKDHTFHRWHITWGLSDDGNGSVEPTVHATALPRRTGGDEGERWGIASTRPLKGIPLCGLRCSPRSVHRAPHRPRTARGWAGHTRARCGGLRGRGAWLARRRLSRAGCFTLRASGSCERSLLPSSSTCSLMGIIRPTHPPPRKRLRAREFLAPFRAEVNLLEEPALSAPPSFRDQLTVIEESVPIFSVTSGTLASEDVETLRRRGMVAIGTATTPDEAHALVATGIQAVVVQSSEAAGHRATFASQPERSLVGMMALLPRVADAVKVPIIAAGAIMDGRGIAAALALGATGVQLGTAFLACPESGASPTYRRRCSPPGATTPPSSPAHSPDGSRAPSRIDLPMRRRRLPSFRTRNRMLSLQSSGRQRRKRGWRAYSPSGRARQLRSREPAQLVFWSRS